MDIRTEQNLNQLNLERTWASELIAAVGLFLDKAHRANCPKLKASCDQLINCGLAMITHHTKCIADLRAGEAATQIADAKRVVTTSVRQQGCVAGRQQGGRMPSQMHTQKPARSVVAGRCGAR